MKTPDKDIVPQFIDYLFAPGKSLELIYQALKGPAQVTPGGNTVATVSNGFCFVRDVGGGQFLHVCSVLGYQMPSFVFFASLLIIGLFFVSSLVLFLQCARLGLGLRSVANELAKVDLMDKKVNPQTLALIHSLMRKQNSTAHLWHEFEETLLISGPAEEVFATQSIESVFTKNALIEDNVHTTFYNAVPGILTGVGLLMTFVAILDGLSHVSVAANMDVQGIGGLINGLSGKFVSSIAAVTCAVSFVFVERIAYAQPNQAYRKLMNSLSTLFKRKTTEQLLFGIQSQLLAQAVMQKELAQGLYNLQSSAPKMPERNRAP